MNRLIEIERPLCTTLLLFATIEGSQSALSPMKRYLSHMVRDQSLCTGRGGGGLEMRWGGK